MKKNLIINLIIGILVVGATIGLVFGLKETTKLAEYKEYFPTANKIEEVKPEEKPTDVTLISHYDLFEDEKRLGGAYTVEVENYYGVVGLTIYLNTERIVVGYQIVTYNQTLGQHNVKAEIPTILNKAIGEAAIEFPKVAGVSISSGAVTTILLFVDTYTDEKTTDIYEELFGEGYEFVVDESFVANANVVKREVIVVDGVNKGQAYTVTGKGVTNSDNPGSLHELSLKLVFDAEEKLVHHEELVNDHTGGFKHNVGILLKSGYGKTIAALAVDLNVISGATNSTSLTIALVKELNKVYILLGGA